ncbi:MAG: HD domain-containing protein [Desulfobacterales bacterium]|nr:HD domain-containing protein [Desulfobacterales bacterium]
MTTLSKDWLNRYPPPLPAALAREAARCQGQLYVSGGTVRDWLLGRPANDLDITVASGGRACARRLAATIGGTYVDLDPETDVARVVWQGLDIDFSSFREDTDSIEADLGKRDFTINAMAVSLAGPGTIIDPCNGLRDLGQGLVRCPAPRVFDNDPLRMVRAYRFMAVLGFGVTPETEAAIKDRVSLIDRVSPERLTAELRLIMASDRAGSAISALAARGLLTRIFPELLAGVGMSQPASHHLDVFAHGLAALERMERILAEPGRFYPGHEQEFRRYLDREERRLRLKWAALFHDLGKPEVRRIRPDKDNRITFYNHDRAGAARFEAIARRLRWSRRDRDRVSRLIELHMYPFHLNNARLRTGLTPRAYLRLVKAAGAELPGLFLLAMADSLAGQGPEKPRHMEAGLVALYNETARVVAKRITPVLALPRLLGGKDLIAMGIPPGPLYGRILDGLEAARVEGEVRDRDQAGQWVRAFLQRHGEPDVHG